MTKPILLNDQQVQQFICDGYLILKPTVPAEVHQTIDKKFTWLAENEDNPGNNILSRLPELNTILNCPEVIGAISSLLGQDYITCTHSFWHRTLGQQNEQTADRKKIREKVIAAGHQDNFCPSAIGKSHNLQYIRFMYYSHDMTLEHGPTHITPGTQYSSEVQDDDRERLQPVVGEAGTIFISHFELIHGGCPNVSNRYRHMIKFLFTRRSKQTQPSWNFKNNQWLKPASHSAQYELDNCWHNQWDWLCGDMSKKTSKQNKNAFLSPVTDFSDTELVEFIQNTQFDKDSLFFLFSKLNQGTSALRTSSIYAIAEIKEDIIKELIEHLRKIQKPANTEMRMPTNTFSFDDLTQVFIAMGPKVVKHLSPLLDSDDEWLLLNTLHILNIIGSANDEVCSKVEQCLQSKSDFVVAWAVTVLSCIGSEKHIPLILDIFDKEYDIENHEKNVLDASVLTWPHQWIIHFNVALAMVRFSHMAKNYEDRIASYLGHPFAQVDFILCQCLRRIGTYSALEKVTDYALPRMWDHSLKKGRNF